MTISEAAKKVTDEWVNHIYGYLGIKKMEMTVDVLQELIQQAIDTDTADLRQQLAEAQAENRWLRERLIVNGECPNCNTSNITWVSKRAYCEFCGSYVWEA